MSTSAYYYSRYIYWKDRQKTHQDRVNELQKIYDSYSSGFLRAGIDGYDDTVNQRITMLDTRMQQGLKGTVEITSNRAAINEAKECDALQDANISSSRTDIALEKALEETRQDEAKDNKDWNYQKYKEAKREGK